MGTAGTVDPAAAGRALVTTAAGDPVDAPVAGDTVDAGPTDSPVVPTRRLRLDARRPAIARLAHARLSAAVLVPRLPAARG
ncbi:hypothetical protein [Micromonospora sp. NPDC005710]|uniref:hypothetical protein n=1 Tax=Micromonospora sp. NPDC005710 TaxID=3157051 RepID=UPI0033F31A51